MSVNDPLGDMLTRIRNALMRNKRTVNTPASALRRRVLDVLKSEGYIRDYAEVEHANGLKEFEIELKYFEGDSVAAAFIPVSGTCRSSRTALASRSCPRPRA
jgi:small subunit ribosomal protein S8